MEIVLPFYLTEKKFWSPWQALAQLLALGVTLLVAIVTGYITGVVIGIKGIFDPMDDDEMFHDDIFFQIPGLEEEADSGEMPKRISMAGVCKLFLSKIPPGNCFESRWHYIPVFYS